MPAAIKRGEADPLNLIRLIPAEGKGALFRPLLCQRYRVGMHLSSIMKTQILRKLRLYTLLCSGVLCGSHATNGQDRVIELEPFPVTADPLRATSQELPKSASFFNSETLNAPGMQHMADLISSVPNLTFAGGTARPRYFMIRGIGENSQFHHDVPPSSVGFLLDGIDFTGLASGVSLFDLEQVEVLRGPQSTVYGATALAGLIVVRSAAPTEDFSGSVEVGAGDDRYRTAGAALGGPLGQTLGFRLSVHHLQQDGFRTNTFLNRRDTNARDETTARLRLVYKPSENLLVDATLLYLNFDNGYDVWSLDNNSLSTRTDDVGRDFVRTLGLGLRSELRLNDRFEVHYAGGIQNSDTDYRFDWDWSNPADLMDRFGLSADVVGWFNGIDAMVRERVVTNHDIRLVNLNKAGDAISWVSGVYFRHMREHQDRLGRLSRYQNDNVAAYVLGRSQFNDQWSGTMGLRAERSEVRFRDERALNIRESDMLWGANASLEFAPADDQLLYLAAGRGFKAAGINMDPRIPLAARTYDAETLINLETGYRTLLFNRRLQLNTSVFHSWRRDMQVESSVQTGDGLNFRMFTDNAAAGRNYGLESDFVFLAGHGVRVFGGLGLLRAVFDEYQFIDRANPANTVILDGRRQTYAPSATFNLGAEWSQPVGFFARVQLSGRSGYQFNAREQQRLGGYSLTNASLGYQTNAWRLALWVNNLWDKTYDVRGFFFANEPPNYNVDRRWVTQGDPRQIGITIRYSF